jgi:hypothetical protein
MQALGPLMCQNESARRSMIWARSTIDASTTPNFTPCRSEDSLDFFDKLMVASESSYTRKESATFATFPHRSLGLTVTSEERGSVVKKIESIYLDMTRQLATVLDGRIELSFAARNGTNGSRTLTYPRNLSPCSRSLAQILRVMEVVHEHLLKNAVITKRDLYYRDVRLFRNQTVVDRIVDDLAATISVNRSSLNVRATSKGLFCGSGITLTLNGDHCLRAGDREVYSQRVLRVMLHCWSVPRLPWYLLSKKWQRSTSLRKFDGSS